MKQKTNKLAQFKQWILSIVRRSYMLKKANERLDWEEFYNVMQSYRTSPMTEQHKVINAYEDVKKWIRDNYA